jgi:hypothetical protein
MKGLCLVGRRRGLGRGRGREGASVAFLCRTLFVAYWGSGLGVEGLVFGVQDLGFGFQSSGFGVEGSVFGVQD